MSTESPILIALGGNLGDVLATFRHVLSRFPEVGIEPLALSSAYQTVPLTLDGGVWQPEVGPPAYWNAVSRVRTKLSPHALLEVLHQLEAEAGRIRRERWESRALDLDLLGYGSEIIEDETLRVPHPGIAERLFVLLPLVDVAPQWVHPSLGVPVMALLERLGTDRGEILGIERCWAEGPQQHSP